MHVSADIFLSSSTGKSFLEKKQMRRALDMGKFLWRLDATIMPGHSIRAPTQAHGPKNAAEVGYKPLLQLRLYMRKTMVNL